ncbi:hypothetical protein [Saccharopolyspora gregorii]|uniref:Uncharacterized protein n=1 Tax=Saccharopolyspora gregorii TaxID=33914 RepID=A0ABP6S367_9PSEU
MAVRYRRDRRTGSGALPRPAAPALGVLAERGAKVVTNAGGFHPAGLAAALRES